MLDTPADRLLALLTDLWRYWADRVRTEADDPEAEPGVASMPAPLRLWHTKLGALAERYGEDSVRAEIEALWSSSSWTPARSGAINEFSNRLIRNVDVQASLTTPKQEPVLTDEQVGEALANMDIDDPDCVDRCMNMVALRQMQAGVPDHEIAEQFCKVVGPDVTAGYYVRWCNNMRTRIDQHPPSEHARAFKRDIDAIEQRFTAA